jgi:uncharacterized RDD family membrane protein YckC
VASGTDTPPTGQRGQGRQEPPIDWPVFATTAVVVLGVCLIIFLSPAAAGAVITDLHGRLTRNLGFLYQWYVIALLGFLGFIAFSRHGKIRLGGRDAKPDFSTVSWIGMIFCSGVGLLHRRTAAWGRAAFHGRHRMGGDLRHLPLGSGRLGHLLRPDHRHRLRLLPAR